MLRLLHNMEKMNQFNATTRLLIVRPSVRINTNLQEISSAHLNEVGLIRLEKESKSIRMRFRLGFSK